MKVLIGGEWHRMEWVSLTPEDIEREYYDRVRQALVKIEFSRDNKIKAIESKLVWTFRNKSKIAWAEVLSNKYDYKKVWVAHCLNLVEEGLLRVGEVVEEEEEEATTQKKITEPKEELRHARKITL